MALRVQVSCGAQRRGLPGYLSRVLQVCAAVVAEPWVLERLTVGLKGCEPWWTPLWGAVVQGLTLQDSQDSLSRGLSRLPGPPLGCGIWGAGAVVWLKPAFGGAGSGASCRDSGAGHGQPLPVTTRCGLQSDLQMAATCAGLGGAWERLRRAPRPPRTKHGACGRFVNWTDSRAVGRAD